MNIRAMMLAGLLGSTFLAGAALAAENVLTLSTAAKEGNRAAVQSLLNSPVKPNVAGAEGTAALVWAASRNDLEMAELLLRAGANPKGVNDFGATALYAAAGHTSSALAEKLLAAGADANAALMSGETPLMLAARRGNLAMVRALLSGGADPNAQEKNAGQTALMEALSKRHDAVANELLQRGAKVDLGSKTGFTPLMFAAQQGDTGAISTLIKAGAKVNDAQPGTKLTPLIIAAAMSHADAVELLLDNGANPNHIDSRGYTAMHLIVRDSDYGIYLQGRDNILKIVKSLLAHKADPNIRLVQENPATTGNEVSLGGATALILAAEVNNYDVVKALLDAGADPKMTTDNGHNALHMAAGGATDVQRMRSPEERATAIQTVKLLLDKGIDVNDPGQFGWTALHAATYQGMTDVMEFLVSKGAKLDEMDVFGQTPLSIAMTILTADIGARRLQIPRRYRKEVVDSLVKMGAKTLEETGVQVVFQRTGDLDQ
jgi:ankyrin repeat protein